MAPVFPVDGNPKKVGITVGRDPERSMKSGRPLPRFPPSPARVIAHNTIATAGREYCAAMGMVKTLSLVESGRAGVHVPRTLVVADHSPAVLREATATWKKPLILRMDFRSKPERKFLGGIEVFTQRSLARLVRFLRAHDYYPMIHPYINRFANLYSANVDLRPNEDYAYVEVVGPGFDAGDLRLGFADGHEKYTLDMREGDIREHTVVSGPAYAVSRRVRIDKVAALRRYTGYANRTGRLCYSLREFTRHVHKTTVPEPGVPESYQLMPRGLRQSLYESSLAIWGYVVRQLPFSGRYVASFSFLRGVGWLLWDVYGNW